LLGALKDAIKGASMLKNRAMVVCFVSLFLRSQTSISIVGASTLLGVSQHIIILARNLKYTGEVTTKSRLTISRTRQFKIEALADFLLRNSNTPAQTKKILKRQTEFALQHIAKVLYEMYTAEVPGNRRLGRNSFYKVLKHTAFCEPRPVDCACPNCIKARGLFDLSFKEYFVKLRAMLAYPVFVQEAQVFEDRIVELEADAEKLRSHLTAEGGGILTHCKLGPQCANRLHSAKWAYSSLTDPFAMATPVVTALTRGVCYVGTPCEICNEVMYVFPVFPIFPHF
jgi:hypothetical protein